MDRYIKGLLTGYERILKLINDIDPECKDIYLEILRIRISASISAYRIFLNKDNITEYEAGEIAEIKELEGTATLDDMIKFFEELNDRNAKKESSKLICVSPDYFTYDSKDKI